MNIYVYMIIINTVILGTISWLGWLVYNGASQWLIAVMVALLGFIAFPDRG